ncbi:hypothetical protein ABK040_014177 [Willaertia magna]
MKYNLLLTFTVCLFIVIVNYSGNCQNFYEKKFLSAMNEIRVQFNLRNLTWNDDLELKAKNIAIWCRYMPTYKGFDIIYFKASFTQINNNFNIATTEKGGLIENLYAAEYTKVGCSNAKCESITGTDRKEDFSGYLLVCAYS